MVDTSVWVEMLGRLVVPVDYVPQLSVCGPIVQEVLQGLKPVAASHAFREAFLALPVLSNPIPLELFLSAADIYRQGRKRGLTIRSSVDCLIAAVAIGNSVPIWHRDRDFTAIARDTPLETH